MAESVHSSMALPTIKGNDYPVNRAGVNQCKEFRKSKRIKDTLILFED